MKEEPDATYANKAHGVCALVFGYFHVQMKLEYLKREQNIVANPETYRGFSSYLFRQNRTRDHCVIGQESFYRSIRIAMLISIAIATLFICFVLPIPLMDHCKRTHETSQPNSKSNEFYALRADVILSIIIWMLFIIYFTDGIIKRLPEANAEADVKVHYGVFVILVFAYPIAAFGYTMWMSKKNGLKDMLITSGCEHSTIFLFYYCSGFSAITCVAQFVIFHTVYIAIATTIVSLLQILSFILLCIAVIVTIRYDITYILKAVDKGNCSGSRSCSLQAVIMLLLLNVVLFWNFVTFIYISENGDFPVIMQSITVLSIARFFAKKSSIVEQMVSRIYLSRGNHESSAAATF